MKNLGGIGTYENFEFELSTLNLVSSFSQSFFPFKQIRESISGFFKPYIQHKEH